MTTIVYSNTEDKHNDIQHSQTKGIPTEKGKHLLKYYRINVHKMKINQVSKQTQAIFNLG